MFVVTGAAGFIGSVLAVELAKKYGDEKIVAVDFVELEDGRWDNLAGANIHDRVEPENLIGFLDEYKDEVRAVFHMGANSDTAASEEDAKKWNLEYSKHLAKWCAENECPMIYASSAATYGNGECGYTDSQDIEFLDELAPLNHYGRSKNDFDKWLIEADKRGEAPCQWVGLKFFNVYGPNEYHKGRMSSVVLHGFNQIVENGEVKLFESHKEGIAHGEQMRDFVYVKDVVRSMMWFYEHPDASGLFNQGTGEARTFLDLAKATFAAMGKEEKISFIPTPEKFRAQYQYFTEADMCKFEDVTGGEIEFTSLEDGVKDYVQNYLMMDKKKHS